MQDNEELEQRIVEVLWNVCGAIMPIFPACILMHGLRRPRHPNQIWLQKILNACQLLLTHSGSLSSLSMGTVNQYTLIAWLDPLGTKTSSINHASIFQAAVPLQPSAPPARNGDGRGKDVQTCVYVLIYVCGRGTVRCREDGASLIVTRVGEWISDLQRTQFVS